MNRFRVLSASLVSCVCLSLLGASSAHAATIVAVAQTVPPTVVTFDTATAGTMATSVPLGGLGPTEVVVGIDLNPRDGVIYMLTRDTTTSTAYISTLDPFSGARGTRITLTATPGDSAPYTTFNASNGEVDIDPVTGVMRVTNVNRENWRIDLALGRVTTDTAPAYTYGGVAFANNVASSTSSTYYAHSWISDELHTWATPSSGIPTTISPTGIVSGGNPGNWGLDIAADGSSFAIGLPFSPTIRHLYSVNLVTGAFTLIGTVGSGTVDIGDFTVLPNIVAVSTPTVSTTEGTAATVHLTRTSAMGTSRVDWSATAAAGADADDYTASGSAVFAPGITELDVPIPVTDDATFEPTETFTVTFARSLDAATLDGIATMAPQRAATVTIAASDKPEPVTITVEKAPADTLKPFVYLSPSAAMKYRAFAKSGVAVSFFTSEAVTGTVTLRLGTKVVGKAPVSSKRAALVSKRIKLTKAGAKLVTKAKGKRIALTMTLVVKDAAGNALTTKRPFTLVR